MNLIRFVIVFIFVAGLMSCVRKTESLKEKTSVIVDVIIAQKVHFTTSIEVNGAALSEEKIELYPEVSGRLVYLNLPDGATVSKGTVLARINDAELQAELGQQNVQMELAEKTELRLRKLLAVNGVNQSDYDVALNQVNTIKANINILQAQIDKTVIKAAFDGKLGLRLVSPGAFVTPQTLLGNLQQTDKIKIDFSVPETYADLVEVRKTVYIRTNNIEEFQNAFITAVEPQINDETRNIRARARLDGGKVSPGAFVKVNLNKDVQGIIAPSNCIIPDASSNQVVVIKNNKAVFVKVETGIRNADKIELVSGVNPGDTIVISGVLFVRPNATVKIRSVITQDEGNILGSKQLVK